MSSPQGKRGAEAVHVYVAVLPQLLSKFRCQSCMVGGREIAQGVPQSQLGDKAKKMSDRRNTSFSPYATGRTLSVRLLIIDQRSDVSLDSRFELLTIISFWVNQLQ